MLLAVKWRSRASQSCRCMGPFGVGDGRSQEGKGQSRVFYGGGIKREIERER